MPFNFWIFDLGFDLLLAPGSKREILRIELEVSLRLFNIFVSDNWLDCGVCVVDEELVDGFERDLRILRRSDTCLVHVLCLNSGHLVHS